MSVIKNTADLKKLFVAKLATSGLNLTDAKHLKLTPMLAADITKLQVPAFGGFKIPYFDLDGKPTSFYRVRYLETTKTGFNAITTAKEQRYVQPAKTLNEVYIPPFIPWKQYLADPAAPLIFTEGELKAACAAKLGLPAMALGGVYCFRSGANNLPILPWFKTAPLAKRPIYIIFDSDAATNPQVVSAENGFARELLKLGGVPHIVRLPNVGNLTLKTGLDDFLLAQNVAAVEQLMKDAKTFEQAVHLHQLNEEVLYIRDPGVILELKTLHRISPRAFVDHAYSTRTYTEPDASGKLKDKSAPSEWLKWRSRAEVEKVTYAPGAARVTADGCLNVWPGWAVEPVQGSIKPWEDLLGFLFNGCAAEYKYADQWFGYPIKHPGTKLTTSVVLWGLIQGTGKSAIGYAVGAIHGKNFTEIRDADLHAPFNEWAENKTLIMGDEITGGNKRDASDRMKAMITRKELRVNPKFVPSYTVPDRINYYFTSNHPDSFFLEDSDRRYFIHEVWGNPLPKSFYVEYFKWLENGGASALFYHFLTMDYTGFEPFGHAPLTVSKQQMIAGGRSDIGDWVNTLREDPNTVLRVDRSVIPFKLWRSEDLLGLYDPTGHRRVTANGLGRELRRAGFVQGADGAGIRTATSGQVRLWIIRDILKLRGATPGELGALYEDERKLHEKAARSTRKM